MSSRLLLQSDPVSTPSCTCGRCRWIDQQNKSGPATSKPSAALRSAVEGGGRPHRIDARRGATAEDVEFVIETVDANFALFASNMAAFLQNLNENLPIGHGVSIDSFLGTLADLRADLIGDLMGAADYVAGD